MADDKVGLHKGYEHWVSPAPLNEDWDKDLEFVLIRTLDDLRVHDVEHKFVAWDTETSGLNPEMDWIVGFSFSFDGKTGYYVPVKHDDIALGKEALDIFYSILKKAGTQLLYNCRFDQRFMEYAGYNLEGLPYYDAMNAIWLADTNMVLPSLKGSERHYMGWTPKTFSETLGDATTFQHVPAEDAYKYACLVGETEVCMSDKRLKKIADIQVGDVVQTVQGNRQVTAVYDNGTRSVCKLSFMDGTLIYATKDHKFLVWINSMQRDWMTVEQIMSSSRQHHIRLVTLNDDGSLDSLCIDLYASTLDVEERHVYDIQVKDVHNFRLANGTISHNCTDAIGTYKIAMISNRYYVENKPASKYDNDMLYPLMRLENTPQRLDTEYLLSLRPQVDETIERTKAEVYRLAGQEFNLNSPQQFGKILVERFAVDTGARTATGSMKADLKTVDAWLTKHSATVAQDVKDFLKAYKEYKKTVKFKSAYLEKYIKAAQEQDKFPVRFSYKVQSVPCLTENNVVLLKNKGIVSIKDVKENDEIWTSWGYKRVLWNHAHDVDEFYRVTLNNGMRIEGTGHHPVLVRKSPLESIDKIKGMTKDDVEWAGLESLIKGEPVIMNHKDATSFCTCDKWKQSFARVVGYFFGGGRELDKGVFSYYFDDLALCDFYYILLSNVFGKDNVIRSFEKGYECFVSHRSLACFLEEHGVIQSLSSDSKGTQKLKKLPFYLGIAKSVSMKPDTLRYFLRGYLDAQKTTLKELRIMEAPEGWVEGISENRVVFLIPTAEKKTIIPLLWACAIDCTVTGHKFGAWFGGAWHGDHLVTRIEITNPMALSNLLSLWDKGDFCLKRFSSVKIPETFRLYSESEVKSTELIERKTTVYDIEVEDVHEYVANGIVTHNTGRLSCGADAKNSFFTKNNVQCLEENTEVLTSEGKKPIKDIVTGELVWSGSAFVPCVQLGSKQKRCETIWTYFGKITASLEHKFYTLNLVTFELEWECLGNAISCGKPLVRNTNDGGFTFRELLENEMFKKSMLLKPELSEERIKELEEIFEDVRFDMIRKADNFWYPNIIPPEVTVYDLCVPAYERFTANGFIVHNSTPKPHAIMLKGRKATEQEIAEKKDILGWYFSNDIPDEEAKGLVEGMEPGNLNIRRAFLPENDQCYVVSIDMAAEELRIVANLCHEDTWINAFNSGADVHKACYSPDTEFMTERGWLTADEITPDMKIAYYDDKTDSVKFTRADKRCTNDATEVYSREDTFDVTDNHRMYVRCANEESYGIVLAKDLKSKGNPRQRFTMKVSMGNPIDFGYVMKSILDPIFFMSGFVIASKHEIKDDRLHLTLCHPCLSMPYSVLSMVEGSNIRTTSLTLTKEATHRLSVNGFLRSSETLLSHVVEMLSQDSGTVKKDFTQQMVCGLVYGLASREDSELHIGNGDGIHGRVYIEDKSLADVIQWALTLNGISCQCVYGIHKKKYVLHVKTLKDNAIGMSYHSVKKQNVAGKNLVYSCFTVPSGLLVTRYHGRITVNGNTAIKLFGEENYSKDARKKAKCVAGDTILHTADGHTIAIRDLVSEETRKNAVIGEPVELPEPKTRISTPDGWSPVTHWISNGKKDTLKLIIERQLTLEVTPDHLVGKYDPDASDDLSKKYRLVRADSLSVGHYVLWDYCPMRITDIQKGSSDVYDITVDNASHTFHANGVVVHNCASFGILYGSGAQGFNNSFPDMTLDECREFMTKFKAALPNITSGQQAYVEHAKIYGCVPTAFGRMRRVRWFLQSGDRAKVAFGERTVKNCYSPDTEFLTKDGWKLAKDILPDTQLAYYVPEKKIIRYTNAGERYTHRCTESVVYHSVSGAWNVTTNHRMWVSKNGNDFESIVADKLCDMDKFTVITSSFMDDENAKHKHDETAFTIDGKSFTFEDMAFLLGVCIRRGVITYGNGGGSRDGVLTVTCDASQIPVSDRLKNTFCTLLKETKRLQAGKYLKLIRFGVSLRDYVKENIGKTRKAFHVPAWISDADTLTVEAFIAGVVGQKMIEHPNELFTFRTHDKKLADDIQRLCTMCGFFTRLMANKDANGKNAFTMYIQRMTLRIIGNYKRDEYRQRPVHKVTHEEMEYSCFEVPSHILVTRYRGFVSYHMNTTVQGTAADVLKLIFCRLWKKVFKPYPQVKFMSTIHDEVNFSIPIELAREVIPICMECMTINRSDWPVTLKCSLSVSRTDLGSLVPFTYDFEHDTYEPEWDTLDVKPKKKEEPKLVAAVPDETKQDEAEMELHFEFLTDEDMLF